MGGGGSKEAAKGPQGADAANEGAIQIPPEIKDQLRNELMPQEHENNQDGRDDIDKKYHTDNEDDMNRQGE